MKDLLRNSVTKENCFICIPKRVSKILETNILKTDKTSIRMTLPSPDYEVGTRIRMFLTKPNLLAFAIKAI